MNQKARIGTGLFVLKDTCSTRLPSVKPFSELMAINASS